MSSAEHRRPRVGPALRYGFLMGVALVTAGPLVYAFFASFKPLDELLTSGAALLPSTWRFENYSDAWTDGQFATYSINSAVVTVGVVVFDVLAASMCGYVLARSRFPGRRLITAVLAGGLLLGAGTATLFPRLVIAQELGMVNLVGIIFVELSAILVIHVFIVRAFCSSLDKEIEEAARVDGCGLFRTFWYVAFPLMMPISSTIGLLALQASWNAFQVPLVFTLSQPELRTIPVGIYALGGAAGEGVQQYSLLLAGAMIALIPIIAVFLIVQRYFVRSLTEGALKG